MSSRKDHELMENLDKCFSIVQQNSARGGTSAVEIAEKMGKHRTTVHGYLNTLEYMGKIESQHGTWHAKTGEKTIIPLEKEIVIELPLPKNKWYDLARLEVYANYMDDLGMSSIAEMPRTIIKKFNETRTITIRGKNVNDIDLEKIGALIQQANKKSSIFNLSGLFKGLRKTLPSDDEAISLKKAKNSSSNKSSET
jgi:hypothetical protein